MRSKRYFTIDNAIHLSGTYRKEFRRVLCDKRASDDLPATEDWESYTCSRCHKVRLNIEREQRIKERRKDISARLNMRWHENQIYKHCLITKNRGKRLDWIPKELAIPGTEWVDGWRVKKVFD